jgi:FdhE protein
MTTAVSTLESLRRQRPEWTPWLAVVADVCDQTSDGAWAAAVPSRPLASQPGVPLLADASIWLPTNLLQRNLTRLLQRASASGTSSMATLARLLEDGPDARALFAASVSYDGEVVKQAARRADADADALQAVVGLLCVPFLAACHRQWATAIPENWTASYCPICASWPAFVEVRGIERTRHARCGRCGAGWHARLLQCLYCANSDHEQLVTLVPQGGAPTNAIEACALCRGYLKVFTRLQGCSPGSVYLEDLASVDLDIAALDAGYSRTHGAGYPLAITVQADATQRGRWLGRHER